MKINASTVELTGVLCLPDRFRFFFFSRGSVSSVSSRILCACRASDPSTWCNSLLLSYQPPIELFFSLSYVPHLILSINGRKCGLKVKIFLVRSSCMLWFTRVVIST